MISVLHVGKFYPPASGGMERLLQLLCEGERAQGADSRVLVANTEARTVHDIVGGVPVTRVAAVAATGAVVWCPSFPAWLRRLAADADVLVIHEPNPIALVSYAAARPRRRLLVWFHSEVVRPRWRYRLFYWPFLRPVLDRAEHIIVSSPALVQHADALKGYREKCVVIPFGLDTSHLDADAATLARAAALRAQYAEPLVLFVGRMVGYKGVDILVRAMTGVDARLVLVGDGPRRAELVELAGDLGLAGRVTFAGQVSDDEMRALYRACDVFVLPSVTRAEAFGLVQLEAMAAGKPVVSTSVPSGVPWVNQHGRTGLVVRPGDVPALREAINRLLKDPDLRSRMGRAGRDRVAAEFTVGRMVAQVTALYARVLTGGRQPRPTVVGEAGGQASVSQGGSQPS